jgi:hypothetical protein
METHPLPHKTLTEDEIKQRICLLTTELHELKDHLDQQTFELKNKIDFCESVLHDLKRHFCPEKFQQVLMTGADLSELMAKGYPNLNIGGTQAMKRFNKEAEDDTPA